MHISISQRVDARPEVIFPLAAHVEYWPRLLPHYRSVQVLARRGRAERLVYMAARREVAGRIGVPLHWTSIQRIDVEQHRIAFEHVAGISRGMRVTWSIVSDASDASASLVTIQHWFSPAWPVPAGLLHLVVGEYFVNGVARRTLRVLGERAEAEQRGQIAGKHRP